MGFSVGNVAGPGPAPAAAIPKPVPKHQSVGAPPANGRRGVAFSERGIDKKEHQGKGEADANALKKAQFGANDAMLKGPQARRADPWAPLVTQWKDRQDSDQSLRKQLASEPNAAVREKLENQMLATDKANLAWLKPLIEKNGWPKISQVGADAAETAWLIAQHSPDYAFQKHCLELMAPLVESKEVGLGNYALTEDRVRDHDHQPQRFGSQFVTRDGVMRPLPIEDPDGLDARRVRMGLEPFAAYAQRNLDFTQPKGTRLDLTPWTWEELDSRSDE